MPGGGTERERETVRSIPGMLWYHRSSSPTGPLPKKIVGQFWLVGLRVKKDGPGPVMVSDSAIPSALQYTFWEPELCTEGQRVLLTITGPGPSF